MLNLKRQYFGHMMWRSDSLEKTLILGKIEGRRIRGMAEDEMVGWHHRFDGNDFEQALGVCDGWGSLECCSPWGSKSWTRLNDWTELIALFLCLEYLFIDVSRLLKSSTLTVFPWISPFLFVSIYFMYLCALTLGFPGVTDCKESAGNVGDPGSIPR